MYKKIKFSTPLFWILVLIIFPISNQLLSPQEIAFTILTLVFFAATGGAILIRTSLTKEYFIFWGISIFIGSFITGVLSIIFKIPSFIIFSTVPISIYFIYKNLNLNSHYFTFNYSILSILISIGVLIAFCFLGNDYLQASSYIPIQEKEALPDPYFFTLLVHSLSVSSPFNAFYDLGGSINYQIFSFISPAFFSKATNVNAQISLWGIWMPFYKILGMLIIGYAINTSINYSYKIKWHHLPLAVVLVFALAPIHPKYFLQFDFINMIWLGDAYLLPGGNPPFTASFIIVGILFKYLLTETANWNRGDMTIFTMLIAWLIGFKIAIYLPMGILIGLLAIYYSWNNKHTLLLLSLASLPTSIIIYKFIVYGDSYGLIQIKWDPSYYIEYFSSLINSTSYMKGIVIMLLSIIIWGGIRFWILGYNALYIKKNQYLILATFMSLIISILLPTFLRYNSITSDGNLAADVSFDLRQFVRGAFFILTIISAMLVFPLIIKKNRHILYTVIPIMVVSLISVIIRLNSFSYTLENNEWRDEVRMEVNRTKPKKMAMRGTLKYSGQLLAAEGIGPWWHSVKRGNAADYILTNKNFYRSQLIDSVLTKKDPIAELGQIKSEGVDFLVAQPENIQIFNELKRKKHLFQNSNCKWLFSINDIE